MRGRKLLIQGLVHPWDPGGLYESALGLSSQSKVMRGAVEGVAAVWAASTHEQGVVHAPSIRLALALPSCGLR